MSQRPDLVPLLIILIPVAVAAAVLIWMERRERGARSLAALVETVLTWRPVVMSHHVPNDDDDQASVGQVSHQAPEPVSVSATPNTDDTEPVSGVAGTGAIDTGARDIIRASLIAELLDNGLLTNRDKAICQAFRCSKASSSRPDAPFQVALRLVEQHRAKQRPELVGEMVDRVQREVAAEHH